MRSIENHAGNSRTIDWRREVVLSDYCLDLCPYVCGGVGTFAYDVEGANALAIEAKGFGEGLCDYYLHSHIDKVSQAEGVLFEVP